MSGSQPPDEGAGRRVDPGWPGRAAGVRELVGLVLAAVRGPLPVSAGAGTNQAIAPPARVAQADRPAHTSSNGQARNAAGEAGDAAGEPVVRDPAIDDAHAETWRLVTRAQKGDGAAFGELYDRYVDAVYRFVYYRVHDRGLAEDFTSETFLRALRRITTIDYQGRDIGAWFMTIARNIVLDHVKSARRRLEVTTGDAVEPAESAPSTEQTVLDGLTAQRVIAAVKQLGEEQRECLVLRFIQGLSVAETAVVMGKNDGAIKALQHRAVHKLAQLVGPDLR